MARIPIHATGRTGASPAWSIVVVKKPGSLIWNGNTQNRVGEKYRLIKTAEGVPSKLMERISLMVSVPMPTVSFIMNYPKIISLLNLDALPGLIMEGVISKVASKAVSNFLYRTSLLICPNLPEFNKTCQKLITPSIINPGKASKFNKLMIFG